jgi:hypothetical protein
MRVSLRMPPRILCFLINLPSPLFIKEGNETIPLCKRGTKGDVVNNLENRI